ncbi:hypothetical protein QEN19_000326 [Hanseniaspora menglaensis]
MVFYKKQKAMLSDPLVLPSEFSSNTKIFLIKETGEWFARYEDYIKRLWFYMQKNFTCEITSHSNLTFFQAMASEEREFNNLETKFPLKLRDPVAHFLHFNTISRFDYLLEETYTYFKNLYFQEETVFLKNLNKLTPDGVLINDINDNQFVTEFLKSHNMQFDREAATHFQVANGLIGDVNEIGVDLSSPWLIRDNLEEFNQESKIYLIYQPSSFITIQVSEGEIGRDRQAFTRHLLRSFMKLTIVKASRKNGSPWCIKEDYLKHYNLTLDWPEELLKYKEEPNSIGRKNKKKESSTSNIEEKTVGAKKRGRPKSIHETLKDEEPIKKRGRKKKLIDNTDSNTHKPNGNVSPATSDEAATATTNSDNMNLNFNEEYESSPSDVNTNNATPQPLSETVFHFNPNIVKVKQIITSDVEIPRTLAKVNDLLADEDMSTLKKALIEEMLSLGDNNIKDEALVDNLMTLYNDIYVYGGDLTLKDDINKNSSVFQASVKQYDEKFKPKKFDNSKRGYNFTQIFKIYKFLFDFNKVLILEPVNFDKFLALINNENQYEQKTREVKLEFSSQLDFELHTSNGKLQMVEKLYQSVFKNTGIKLHLKEVKEQVKEFEDQYIDLSIEKNPNKYLLELICSLLRLFINNKGEWRVNVPDFWEDENGKEIDKDDALQNNLSDDLQIFIKNCINYKDVSFSERLIKRNFSNGFWCIILMGILEDSFHLTPYKLQIASIFEKFFVKNSSKTLNNLNKLLWENFNYNFGMNDKLNLVEILIDILLNFGSDIKNDIDLQIDVISNCKSERFKVNKKIKALSKQKTTLEKEIEALKLAEPQSEESKQNLEGLIAQQKTITVQIEMSEIKKKFWDDKINVETNLRLKSLGQDRYGHRYWCLESTGNYDINNPFEGAHKRSGKLFIQGPYKQEIPYFYNGLTYDEYSEKIKNYKFPPAGTVVNDQNVPILFSKNIWNNELDNSSLSNIDWKILDWREHYLLSENDWCFIDDEEAIKHLIHWLHKNGSKERILKNNLLSLVERFEVNAKVIDNSTLLYDSIFEIESSREFFNELTHLLSLLTQEDFQLLVSLSDLESDFDILNSCFQNNNASFKTTNLSNDSLSLHSTDEILVNLNVDLVKIETQLEPILSKCMELEDMGSKYPNHIQELKNLNAKKDNLSNDKILILTKIEERENKLKIMSLNKKQEADEEKAEPQVFMNEFVNEFKDSKVLSKLISLSKSINEFVLNETEEKKKDKTILYGYKNFSAIQKFGKNMYNGSIEKNDTLKSKRATLSKITESIHQPSFKERIESLNKELESILNAI